jgi:hypothetical protein
MLKPAGALPVGLALLFSALFLPDMLADPVHFNQYLNAVQLIDFLICTQLLRSFILNIFGFAPLHTKFFSLSDLSNLDYIRWRLTVIIDVLNLRY